MALEDCFKIKDVSEIQISPLGDRIAFVQRDVVTGEEAQAKPRQVRDIYLLILADNRILRLTTHEKGSSYPRWSPDGRYLAFLSSRAAESQIWLLDMISGGEARQLTDWEPGIEEFAWSPDSQRIVYVSADPDKGGKEKKEDGVKSDDPYVITRTRYVFDGVGFYGDPREFEHIWVISLAEPKKPAKVTDGHFDDKMVFWSPDGNRIGFVSNRTGDDDNNDNTDIWTVPALGGEVRQVTTHAGSDGGIMWAEDTSPVWSPDGQFIAYHSTSEPNNLYKLTRLWIIPAGGGKPKCLSESLDRNVGTIVWAKDSQSIYGLVPDKARIDLYNFSLRDGRVSKVFGGENRLSGLALSGDNRFFSFVLEDSGHPSEIYTLTQDGRNLVQRSSLNQNLLDQIAVGKEERIQFKNPDGQTVEGFVLKPPDFNPATRYPLILEIHGGPTYADGNSFSADGQLYAANGYIVLWINYRGSSDYGEAWQEAIAGNWYFKEYDDLMAGIDFMCRKDYVDPQRLGSTGVSYGGIMTTWIVGQTDRFAAAVAERFTVDNFSSYGVDDTPEYYEKDYGLPYDDKNFEVYRRTSPIFYIKNCKTPIMLIQCMEDHRCPLHHALQFYMGLKKLKKSEVQLVLYPREPHGIRELSHQADRLRRILAWFDKYLKR